MDGAILGGVSRRTPQRVVCKPLHLGSQLHQALGPEVPLRTLQRRMQKLARRGLLEKHGTRKDAFYRLPLRGPIP